MPARQDKRPKTKRPKALKFLSVEQIFKSQEAIAVQSFEVCTFNFNVGSNEDNMDVTK